MADLAVDLDVAARLLDEAVHHAQPQAGALADILGGEERLEHFFQNVRRHAAAGVAHRDHHVGARAHLRVRLRIGLVEDDVAGFERELAAVRHRVARIDRKIEQCGGELCRIGDGAPDIVFQHRLDLDLLAERRAQQVRGIARKRIRIDRARLERLAAREGEQLMRQLGAARRGLVDHPGDRGELRPVLHALGEDLDRAGDDGQDVVEVVRDAAGELSDGIHLLRLAQLRLAGDLVGQVADECVEHVAAQAAQCRDGELDPELAAVAPDRFDLEALAQDCGLAGVEKAFEPRLVTRAVRGRHDRGGERPPDRLGARPAEHRLGLPVPLRDVAGLVHLHEGIERRVDDPARHLLAFRERLLGLLALRHVAADVEMPPLRL